MVAGQLWTLEKKGYLENGYEQRWNYCKESPWIIPDEGKEGFVKIGHEPDKYGKQLYLGQEVGKEVVLMKWDVSL